MTSPLMVWPHETFDEHVLMLRSAKYTIDTDVTITPLPAIPEGPGTVLAFGSLPDFVCDVILIAEGGINDVVRVSAALQHWLRGGAPTWTKGDMLSKFAGVRLTEITDPFTLGNVEHALEMQRHNLRGLA